VIKIKAATALFLLGTASSAYAGPVLDAYVRRGIEKNRALKAERAATEETRVAVREARGLFFPSVTLEARYTVVSGETLDIGALINPAYATLNQLTGANRFPTDLDLQLPLTQETKVRAVQPIFHPEIFYNHSIRSSLSESDRAALEAFARKIVATIRTAYWNHAKAARVVELYARTLPLLHENLRVSEELVGAGKATRESVLRAKAELSEVVQKKADAERARDAAARYLNFLIDRPEESPVEIETSTASAPLFLEAPAAMAQANAHREELRQIAYAIEAADANVGLTGAAFLPGLSVAADYGFQGPEYDFGFDKDYFAVSFVLEWNLFRGFQDSAKRERAELELARLRTKQEEIERQIGLEVRQALEGTRVAWEAIATAGERLESARESFEIVATKYENGAASQIEYLEARSRFTNAEINRVITSYDYLIESAELTRALGVETIDL
jgi:outer membrane protein